MINHDDSMTVVNQVFSSLKKIEADIKSRPILCPCSDNYKTYWGYIQRIKDSDKLQIIRDNLWLHAHSNNNNCLRNICYDIDVLQSRIEKDTNYWVLDDILEHLEFMVNHNIPLCQACVKFHKDEVLLKP